MGINFDWFFACFGVSVAVLIISFVTSQVFAKRSTEFTVRLEKLAKENSKEIQDIIARELSPSIHLHDGDVSVAKRAAQIILEVAKETKGAHHQITFYGAASLAAMSKPQDAVDDEPESDNKSPSRIYRDAIDEATRKHVRMRRYISLFSERQLRERSIAIQLQYTTWLKHQLKLLRGDDRYELADVVRAPQWGSNMARIITKNTVMEITGNGRAAIVITDEQIAQRIREYARDAIIGQNPKNKVKSYSLAPDATRSLEEFEKYVNDMEVAYKDEKRKEEELKQKLEK